MVLVCFHVSRFEARIGERGEYIRYDDQDIDHWNVELIQKGNEYLNRAAQNQTLSKYHLEAAIAYWHTRKDESPEKWDNILQLYNRLLQMGNSHVAALNRTYALAKVKGRKDAIAEAEKLKMNGKHFYQLLLGQLYSGIDDQKAMLHLHTALNLAKNATEKSKISEDIIKLKNGVLYF